MSDLIHPRGKPVGVWGPVVRDPHDLASWVKEVSQANRKRRLKR